MDKTAGPGRVKGTLTPPCSKSYAQRALAAALLCGGGFGAAQPRVLRATPARPCSCIETLGARVTRIRRSPRRSPSKAGCDPQGSARLRRRRVGSCDAPLHPSSHRSAPRPSPSRGEGTLLRRPMGDDDTDRCARLGVPGTRQRRIPAFRSPRTDPRRRGRRGRLGFVAVHHGTACWRCRWPDTTPRSMCGARFRPLIWT